ncbi:transporter substrate-binding domain-containing protein [Dongshaea marina]|uniref:transporter substrate-binding domain-containing protein n=1 Tax=Dongshaea marina TaxID=2047966 RepID=UPI000D3ED202|nr:transporter substrate-binding domain-containing protein [Dongshaea marina]
MRYFRAFWILLVSACFISGSMGVKAHHPKVVDEEHEIYWPYLDSPPLYHYLGKDDLRGFGFDIVRMLGKELKGYHNTFVQTSPDRLFIGIKERLNYCMYGVYKTPEREEFMYFSLPARITPPSALVIRKTDLAKFGQGKPLSLQELLKDQKLRFVYLNGVIYSAYANGLIEDYRNDSNLYPLNYHGSSLRPLEMLLRKRADYTLSTPSMLYEADKQELADKIAYIPRLKDYEYQVGYVVCPKNEWGRQLIDKINHILYLKVSKGQYFEYFKALMPANNQAELKEQYQKLIAEPVVNSRLKAQ